MSFKAQQRYISTVSGQIIVSKLSKDSISLPKRYRDWKSFKNRFNNQSMYEYNFRGYIIRVHLRYAFRHFTQNTYNEPRSHLNGVLYDILHNPLLVIKRYDNKFKRNSLQFYKPYKKNSELYHMMMFQVLEVENNVYIYKTLYDIGNSLNKVYEVINATDLNTVYFKYEED